MNPGEAYYTLNKNSTLKNDPVFALVEYETNVKAVETIGSLKRMLDRIGEEPGLIGRMVKIDFYNKGELLLSWERTA